MPVENQRNQAARVQRIERVEMRRIIVLLLGEPKIAPVEVRCLLYLQDMAPRLLGFQG